MMSPLKLTGFLAPLYRRWLEIGLVLLGAWSMVAVSAAYASMEYTSDGFHVFTALRNTLHGVGFFYEGPTYGYLLGVHSYLTLLLLLPVLAIFDSPLTLGLIAPLCHIVGAWVFFRICQDFLLEDDTLAAVAAVLYLFFSPSFSMMTHIYLFQADQLFEPLFMAAVYFGFAGRWKLAHLFAVLVLFLKEEYLVVYPLMFVLVWYAARRSGRITTMSTRRALQQAALWGGSALVCLGVLMYFRGLNPYSYGVRLPYFNLPWVSWGISIDAIVFFLRPLVPLVVVLAWLPLRTRRPLFVALLAILVVRFGMQIYIYNRIPQYHWNNVVLAPAVFLSIALFVFPYLSQVTRMQRRALIAAMSLGILVCLWDVRQGNHTRYVLLHTVTERGAWNRELTVQLDQLAAAMPESRSPRDFIILPQYTFAPLLKGRSAVGLNILMTDLDMEDVERRPALLREAAYVVLPKEETAVLPFDPTNVPQRFFQTHHLKVETRDYYLYGKRE